MYPCYFDLWCILHVDLINAQLDEVKTLNYVEQNVAIRDF